MWYQTEDRLGTKAQIAIYGGPQQAGRVAPRAIMIVVRASLVGVRRPALQRAYFESDQRTIAIQRGQFYIVAIAMSMIDDTLSHQMHQAEMQRVER